MAMKCKKRKADKEQAEPDRDEDEVREMIKFLGYCRRSNAFLRAPQDEPLSHEDELNEKIKFLFRRANSFLMAQERANRNENGDQAPVQRSSPVIDIMDDFAHMKEVKIQKKYETMHSTEEMEEKRKRQAAFKHTLTIKRKADETHQEGKQTDAMHAVIVAKKPRVMEKSKPNPETMTRA